MGPFRVRQPLLWIVEQTVVTAEKTGEVDAQTTPIAVSVLSGDTLARMQAHTVEQVAGLAGRLITAQDEERTRIARDLHDDVSQRLAGVSIAVSGIKRRLGDADVSGDLQKDLADLQQQTLGLARNVRELSHGVAMRCRSEGDFASISAEAALCVYRIAQESLRNVIAHAGASRADVQLVRKDDYVEITIADDGRGFDNVESGKGGKGLGLVSIAERAKLAGGTLWIVTGEREGARVQARIPAQARAASDAGPRPEGQVA